MRFNILADTVFKGSDYVLMSGYNTLCVNRFISKNNDQIYFDSGGGCY